MVVVVGREGGIAVKILVIYVGTTLALVRGS